MKRKRSYAATDVEQIDVASLLPTVEMGCIIAVDAAKTKFVAAIATAAGDVQKLVRFEHPRQTMVFLALVDALRAAGRAPNLVMEPTGTYGDALRYQCHQLSVPVHMMPPKHTHDFAEVFDGVPSMHDAKAASVLAKLHAIKPAPAWRPENESRRNLRAWVDQRGPLARTLSLYFGHLEGMLARHWPEFGTVVDVRVRRSWFALVKAFPGPRAINANPKRAAEVLHSASMGQLSRNQIEAILEGARMTIGVPMTDGEEEKLRGLTEEIEHYTRAQLRVDAEIAKLVRKDEVLSRLATVVGSACAAAIGTLVGSPLDFESASAFEKAMGLNLKEKSSGEKAGQLSITKRGAGQSRQLLYMATLRLLCTDAVAVAWYRGRKAFKGGFTIKAVVAVMRKLARALWHVARGERFDSSKLFDVRRLDVASIQLRPRHNFHAGAPSDTVASDECSAAVHA